MRQAEIGGPVKHVEITLDCHFVTGDTLLLDFQQHGGESRGTAGKVYGGLGRSQRRHLHADIRPRVWHAIVCRREHGRAAEGPLRLSHHTCQ